MSWSFLAVFLATLFVATITPGPSMLLALNHGISFGWRRALATAWGNVAATALQCLVSLLGRGAEAEAEAEAEDRTAVRRPHPLRQQQRQDLPVAV